MEQQMQKIQNLANAAAAAAAAATAGGGLSSMGLEGLPVHLGADWLLK